MMEPTDDEQSLYNEISALGLSLWDKTALYKGKNDDPKMFSATLFSRLWSNHKGYTTLWNGRQSLEADIILRSAVETAICIAANFRLRSKFVDLMRRDAAFTIQGQIKMFRDAEDFGMVSQGEAVLRQIMTTIPSGLKAAKLDWKSLAQTGEVPQLYGFHRMLSGVSSHVTGLSVLRSMTNDNLSKGQFEIDGIERRMHLMMMAGAMLQGSLLHAGMIDAHPEAERASTLTAVLDRLSGGWPGVNE